MNNSPWARTITRQSVRDGGRSAWVHRFVTGTVRADQWSQEFDMLTTFLWRIVGAALLDACTYEEVEAPILPS